jgi:hypothetical protein
MVLAISEKKQEQKTKVMGTKYCCKRNNVTSDGGEKYA